MGGARSLLVLGGVVAVAVGAALWFALGSDDVTDGGETGAGAGSADVTPNAGGKTTDRTPRRRSKTTGTAVVTGLVKRHDRKDAHAGGGTRVANQEVRLLCDGQDARTTRTGDDGAFRFDSLPDGGPYEVQVAAPGFANVRLPGIGLSRGETRDVGTLWLDLAVRVPVVVRDYANRPIAGAAVRAFVAPDYGNDFDWTKAFAQMAVEPVPVATTVTAADGTAAFAELASGHWTFTAQAPGRARGSARSVELRGGEVATEIVIRLATGHSIEGRVLDADRAPVARAVVLAGSSGSSWDMGAAATRSRAVTDAEGRFTLDALDAGTVSLSAGRAGAVPSWRLNVRVPGVERIDVVLATTGSIEGRVTQKETGAAVAGALVRAVQWGWSTQVAEATSDEQGHYRIEAFPTGDVQSLVAEKEGLVHAPPETDTPWGGSGRHVHAGDTLVADLVLQKGSVVTGRVTAAGAPVAGARVKITSWRPNQGAQKTTTVFTGADGRYRAEDVPPGGAFGQVHVEGWYQKDFPEQWWSMTQDESVGREFRVEVPAGGEATLDLTIERGAAVSGRVEGPDGPVGAARVYAGESQTTSAADGTFTLDGVTPGSAVPISATKDRLVPAKAQTIPVEAGAANAGVVVTMARAAVVRGTVVGPDGAAPGEARVAAVAKAPEESGFGMLSRVVGPGADDGAERHPVSADGTFEFPLALSEGAFVVKAIDARLGTAESETVRIEAGRTEYVVAVRFGAPDGIRGRVTAGGKPVAGAHVSATLQQPANQMMMAFSVSGGNGKTVDAVSGPDGAFSIVPLETGTWDVSADAPGFVKGKSVAAKVPAAGAETVVELEAAMEIAGRVLLPDGSPVEGLSVRVVAEQQMNGFGWSNGGDDGASATTARDGSFRLREVAPGAHKLRVEATWMDKVNVKPLTTDPIAAGTTSAKIVVQPGGRIAGRVIDGARKAVVGAWVTANQSDGQNDGTWHGGVTNAAGAFEIGALEAGTYSLNVQAQGGNRQPAQKDGVAAGTLDVEIVLADALAIEGVATLPDGKPAANVYLQAEPVREGDDGAISGGQGTSTDAAGKFKIGGLAPGRYRVAPNGWVDGSKGLRAEAEVVVEAGATGVRVRLVEGLRISGVVVDESGTGIVGASVMVYREDGDSRGATTGIAGAFTVVGLVEGEYHLAANANDRIGASIDKVVAGATDIRVTLAKGLRASGRILDSAGKPFTGQLQLARDGADVWVACDGDGKFVATGLREGDYDVMALVSDPEHREQMRLSSAGRVRAGTSDAELRLK